MLNLAIILKYLNVHINLNCYLRTQNSIVKRSVTLYYPVLLYNEVEDLRL